MIVAGVLGTPATVASASARTATDGCAAGTRGGVVSAYADVFSRATQLTADQRAARLAGGDDPAVRALLDAWLAGTDGATTSLSVSDVQCTSKRRAVATLQLLLNGTPLPKALPTGTAVREAGTWKVSTATFCRRMVLEDPALADGGVCAR